MIKRLKISLNVLLSVFIIISLSFSATLIGINIYKENYIYNALVGDIKEESENVDDYLFDIFYNVALYKNSIFSTNNLNDFVASEDKENYLNSLEASNRLNQDLYYDVALIHEEKYYTINHSAYYLSSTILDKFTADNQLIILDKVAYLDGFALIVGVKNADIYSIFYLKESAVVNFLALSYDNSIGLVLVNEDVLISTNNDVITLSSANLNLTEKEITINDVRYLVLRNTLSNSSYFHQNLESVTLINYQAIFSTIDLVQVLLIVFLVIVSVLVGVISYWMVKRIVRPINALSSEMATLDLDKKYVGQIHQENENNEIYILEKSYQNMITRIQDLMKRQQEDNETQRQLELDSLQMQVNPHFLYNSLDMIAWMSKLANNKNIEEFVILLARFYRLSLHKGAKYIKVCEEIDIIKYYLDIQAKVFPGLFTYEINMDDDICDYLSLKLILQPFVENIIKYAFYGIDRKGMIQIKAYQQGDFIVFEVTDNGCGFDINIFKDLSEKKNGFGIRNVHERLNLEYGKQADLLIDSTLGSGTMIRITIPKSL